MLRVSDGFRLAVRSPSPRTRILLRFGDTIMTREDINLSSGVQFTEPFNLEENLTMGVCPAATFDVTLMNKHGLLSNFEYGEFEASLGVMTRVIHGEPITSHVTAVMRYGTPEPLRLEGNLERPYLTINGNAPTAQPPLPVHALLVVGDVVYCIFEDGKYWAATWVDGRTWNSLNVNTWDELKTLYVWDDIQGILVPQARSDEWDDLTVYIWDELKATRTWNSFFHLPELTPFMQNKLKGWAKQRRGIQQVGDIVHEFYIDGRIERYEYANLGVFIADAPKKRKVSLIAISSLDRMTRFDVIADAFLDALPHPITLGGIFARLCEFVGVPRATMTFINSTRTFLEPPQRTENVTAREVLAWIAEAACSYARMTRYGEVELAWFGTQEIVIPENQYFSIEAAEYEVSKIDKLQILNAETDIGVIIGSGVNAYEIVDNPYLYGASDTEIRTYGAPIYYRLTEFKPFPPVVSTAVCDWSIQAGDIIRQKLRGVEYVVPIYRQVIVWKGVSARVTYENTGAEQRPVNTQSNRRTFEQRRAMHEISVTVDGVTSRITSAEGDIATLKFDVGQFSVEFVTKDGIISAINLSPETARIQAANIQFEGLVTANSLFKILLDGSAEMTNATVSGTVKAKTGEIAGFIITDSTLESSFLTVDSRGQVRFGNDALMHIVNESLTFVASGIPMMTLSGTQNRADINVPLYLSGLTASYGGGLPVVLDSSTRQLQYSNTSSIRYKENVRELPDDFCDINALRPVLFNYIQDDAKTDKMGFVAEHTAKICPSIGISREVNGESVIESIDYIQLLPPTMKKVQKHDKELQKHDKAIQELWDYIKGDKNGTV